MQQSARTSRYLPGLDGLRAIAILGIVLYHMFPGAVRGGYLGVTLFFALSGYLLARTAAANLAEGRWRTVGFYQKRIRRIYPALLWVLALTLLALRLWLPEGLVGIREELESILFGYQNWWQIVQNQDYFSRITSTSPFTHMWSLAVELQYYLVWPLLFGLWRSEQGEDGKWGSIGMLIALAVASATAMAILFHATGDPSRPYYGTDARVHALLLGSAAGLIPEERLRCSKTLGSTLFGLCAAGYLALAVLLDGASPAAYYGLIPLTAVLSIVLTVLCAQEDLPFGRALDWAPLKWLGQRSYEIYLTMYPVLYLMERLRPIEDALWRHLAEGGIILALAVVIHALSVPKAWLAPAGDPGWKWFKRPAAITAAFAFSMGLLITAAAPVEAGDLDALEELLEANRAKIEATLPPAPTETPAPTQEATPVPTVNTAEVSMVGDSVMLGALNALQEALPGCTVDAKVSRQLWDAYAVLDMLESSGALGSTVVVALGTNGPFSVEDGQGIVDRLGTDRKIYWVTAFGTSLSWQEQSNDSIRAIAARNRNVTIIDWAALAANHTEWLYSDGIHLQGEGQQAYAAMIRDALGVTPPPPVETDSAPIVIWDAEQGIMVSDP